MLKRTLACEGNEAADVLARLGSKSDEASRRMWFQADYGTIHPCDLAQKFSDNTDIFNQPFFEGRGMVTIEQEKILLIFIIIS